MERKGDRGDGREGEKEVEKRIGCLRDWEGRKGREEGKREKEKWRKRQRMLNRLGL